MDRAAATGLLSVLDGLPLAIELAASWMDLVSPDQLAERVSSLTTRDHERPERHASLEAVLEGSWDLLTDAEQQALARAAVFAGSFDLDAAEAVITSPELPCVLPMLGRLHDKSLIVVDRGPRYRLLAPVRTFARERRPPDDALLVVHGEHILATIEAGAAIGDWIDEVRAAFEACLSRDPVLACKLLGATHPWDWAHSNPRACLQRARRAQAAADGLDPVQAARMAWAQGYWLTRVATHEQACAVLREALVKADATSSNWLQFGIVGQLCLSLALNRQPDEAAEHLVPRLEQIEREGNGGHIVRSFMLMGIIRSQQGRAEEAEAYFERSIARHGDSVAPGHLADTLRFYSEHVLCLGDLERAAHLTERAFATEASDTFGAQISRLSLAGIRHLEGRLDDAEALLDEMTNRPDTLDPVASATRDMQRAWLLWERGQLDEAGSLLEHTEEAYRRLNRESERANVAASRVALLAHLRAPVSPTRPTRPRTRSSRRPRSASSLLSRQASRSITRALSSLCSSRCGSGGTRSPAWVDAVHTNATPRG